VFARACALVEKARQACAEKGEKTEEAGEIPRPGA